MKKIIVTLMVALFAVPTFCGRKKIVLSNDVNKEKRNLFVNKNNKEKFKLFKGCFFILPDTQKKENDPMDIDTDSSDEEIRDLDFLTEVADIAYALGELSFNNDQEPVCPGAPQKREKFKRVCRSILLEDQKKLNFE